MTDTPISDAAVRYTGMWQDIGGVVPLRVAQDLERKFYRACELRGDVPSDNRRAEIESLRARNDKLAAAYTNERILRYAAEAERNAETERCAKIASDFTLSPVVGKAIAALILRRRE